MEKVYRIIAAILAIGAMGQIVDGFAEFFSRFDEVISDGQPINPSSFEMFLQGLLGVASAAPTLLIAAIFFHMKILVDAISPSVRSARHQDLDDLSK